MVSDTLFHILLKKTTMCFVDKLMDINPIIHTALTWQRDENGSSAEINYLIAFHQKIIPILVKSGSTGSLNPLHSFIFRKKDKLAVLIK